jgi:YD repeat-containing protein
MDNLATLGRRTQLQPFIPLQRSTFEGVRLNLVSTSTGNLAFAINDLELSGVLPILFQRVYDSSRRDSDFGLGVGWSFAFDDRISLDDDGATLTTGAGAIISFRRDGQHFILRQDAPGLHQSFDVTGVNTITEPAAGFARIYQKIGGEYRLSRIADANGNAIAISFGARGNITRIDNGSAAIALTWSDGKNSRLLSVSDSAGRHVSFKQDGQRLRSFVDVAGAQWSYDYANNRLTAATDPLGRMLLRARYDRTGRAIEAGDAAGVYSFAYDSAAAISRQTIVTDPVGAKTLATHNENGALTAVSDEEGQTIAVEYNAANRPTRMLDALGSETKFAYDAGNRLSRQTSSDGTLDKSYAYDANGRIVSTNDGGEHADYSFDARGNVSTKQSDDATQGYEVQRNARGQAIRLVGKNGRTVSFEYDASGNETAFTYSDAGRFESEFDAAGHRVTERLPSGVTFRSEYDARGRLARQSDSRGRSINITRDASGAISELASSSGKWARAERDATGRIVALTNSSGKTRRFAYDARGSLVGYTDARGKHTAFGYDHRGRLHTINNSDGVSLRYDYDRAGKLLAVRRANEAKDAAQFLRASFSPFTSFGGTLTQGDPSCLFGGDGWFEGDTFNDRFGMGCGDPFGDFGDSSGGGGGILLNPETCGRCKERHKQICEKSWWSQYYLLIGADVAGTAACAAVSVGALTPFCALAAGVASIFRVLSLNSEYDSCLLKIPDDCFQPCQTS